MDSESDLHMSYDSDSQTGGEEPALVTDLAYADMRIASADNQPGGESTALHTDLAYANQRTD